MSHALSLDLFMFQRWSKEFDLGMSYDTIILPGPWKRNSEEVYIESFDSWVEVAANSLLSILWCHRVKPPKFWHVTPLWRQGKLSTLHSVLKCNQNLCHAPIVMAREVHHGSSAIGVLVKKSIEKLSFKITSEFHWISFENAGIETVP